MNAKIEQSGSIGGADIAKLVLAVALVLGGVVAYYYFGTWSSLLRILVLLALVVAGFAVGAFTRPGREAREFLAESQFEMRKVVWPMRDETLRTTAVIIVVVIILSLLLGIIDFALKWIVLDHLLKIGG